MYRPIHSDFLIHWTGKDIDKKSFLLLEFAGESGELDISDPVNFGPEVYNRTIQLVEKGVIKSIEKIIELNNK